MGRRKIRINSSWLEFLASLGLTHRQIAAHIGVSEDTLLRRAQEDEEVARALNVDRRDVYVAVAQSLVDAALKGDVRAQIFYLRNRAGWNPPVAPGRKQVEWSHQSWISQYVKAVGLPQADMLPGLKRAGLPENDSSIENANDNPQHPG